MDKPLEPGVRKKGRNTYQVSTEYLKEDIQKMGPEKFKQLMKDKKPQTMKKGGLSAGQKKIAAKAPPPDKIDAKDFAVLKKEKAKGRGMGLQDESIKPGKVMKAKRGVFSSGKISDMSFDEKMKRVESGQINKKTGKFTSMNAMRDAKGFQEGESAAEFNKRRMKLASPKNILNAAKATRYGKIALGIAGAVLGAKELLKSKMKKEDKKMAGGSVKKYSIGTGPLGATKKRPSPSKQVSPDQRTGRAALPSSDTELTNTIKKVKAKYASLKETARDELTPMKSDRVFSKYRRPDSAKEFYADKPGSRYEGMAKEAMQDRINYHRFVHQNRKMAGGMAKKYNRGGGADTGAAGERRSSMYVLLDKMKSRRGVDRITKRDIDNIPQRRSRTPYAINQGMRDRLTNIDIKQATNAIKPSQRKMGGGMMNKPMGYKSGTMVKARGCKLGRTRPTKMY